MAATIDAAALTALDHQPVDWRFKGLPAAWSGRTPAEICADAPELFEAAPLGTVCVLSADALSHNLAVMGRWSQQHGIELAPHGKTHMAPQLAAAQFEAGAVAITVATVSQMRVYSAFGVRNFVIANQVLESGGLRWLAGELADPQLEVRCWVDSVRGVALMSEELHRARAPRPLDVCVEVGATGGRTGARAAHTVDEVAAAAAASPQLRLVGVAGYEAALGHDVSPAGRRVIVDYLTTLRETTARLAGLIETDDIIVTAGGSTHFDLVAEVLTPDWPLDRPVRVVVRSGCHLTHDDGLYHRTSPLTRPDADAEQALRPALSLWAQVSSRPEDDLALLSMGRRDVSFDQDLPQPRNLPGARVFKLNDQHAYLRLADDPVEVGDWLEFGISHPCTVFDKWPMIPVLDAQRRVVQLVRTFF
ncbi:alanine racemase [Mycobacterium sp. ACS4331]|uniref:alanine racemase n=1 Tax=Mycobacterium sp. ACS4331 TaxID=1834121 RepID=UPI0007FF2314|nr:alanine racemase [Mycobacterium sp. ACS4331]OBF16460.1 amino acid deaminase [Mycobacterium sp. ACS4331]